MSKWLIVADNPAMATKEFEDKLAQTDNHRHRMLWEKVIEQVQAELAHDIEGTMRTLVPDPDYSSPGSKDGPKGYDEVKAYYLDLFESGALENMALRENMHRRLLTADDGVTIETTVTYHLPAGLARKQGYAIPDGHVGHCAVHRHLLIVVPFDEEGRMFGEISYGGMNPLDWEPIPDDKLSPAYLDWVQRFAPES